MSPAAEPRFVSPELVNLGTLIPGYLCLAGVIWGMRGRDPARAAVIVTVLALALTGVLFVFLDSIGLSALIAACIAMPAGGYAPPRS